MPKKKRYWLLDCVTALDWMVDAYSLKEAAQKIGRSVDKVRVERMRYLKEPNGFTLYDNPMQGY